VLHGHKGLVETVAIIEQDFFCGKRYYDGQICGQPGAKVVVEDLDPLAAYVRCEDHSRWGDKPFKHRINFEYHKRHHVRLPQVMSLGEFITLLIMIS